MVENVTDDKIITMKWIDKSSLPSWSDFDSTNRPIKKPAAQGYSIDEVAMEIKE